VLSLTRRLVLSMTAGFVNNSEGDSEGDSEGWESAERLSNTITTDFIAFSLEIFVDNGERY